MRTLVLAVAASTLAALAPSTVAAPPPPLLDARGCHSTLHVFSEAPERLQPRFVPASYTLLTWVPGSAYTALWSYRCRSASVDGSAPRPVQLSLAAVPVLHPDRQPHEQPPPELPNTWSHYLHLAVTDDPALARRLQRDGLPARLAPGMRFERETWLDAAPDPVLPLSRSRVTVPGAWRSATSPVVQQEPPHSHRNEFWADTPAGPAVLDLRVPHAEDHFCELSAGETCGTVDALGHATQELLGAAHRSADAAVDHEELPRVLVLGSRR